MKNDEIENMERLVMLRELLGQDRDKLVKAPIILDAQTQAGVQPVLNFIGTLEAHSVPEISEAEARRLSGYFNAMSSYLGYAFNTAKVKEAPPREQIKPAALADLFNRFAVLTGHMMLSDILIVPQDIKTSGPAKHVKWNGAFSQSYEYNDAVMAFSFIEIFEGGSRDGAKGSTTVPVFALDNKMLNRLAPHQPLALIQELQAAMTLVNHDMLHHFTNPYINTATLHNVKITESDKHNMPIYNWMISVAGYNSDKYEDWAQYSHERILFKDRHSAATKELRGMVDRYYDELMRIRNDFLACEKKLGGCAAVPVIDYFAILMPHVLTRAIPLNHPLMTHCLKRIKAVDVDPAGLESRLHGLTDSIRNRYEGTVKQMYGQFDGTMHQSKNFYKRSRFFVIPEIESTGVSYEDLRRFEVWKFSSDEINSHAPHKYNKRTFDGNNLAMIKAVADTVNQVPKP